MSAASGVTVFQPPPYLPAHEAPIRQQEITMPPFDRIPAWLYILFASEPPAPRKKPKTMTVKQVLRDEFGVVGNAIYERLEGLAREAAAAAGIEATILFDPPGGCFGKKPRCTDDDRLRPSRN